MIEEGDYTATVDRLVAGGCLVAFTATLPTSGRLCYLEAFETTGGYIEVIESETWRAVIAAMRAARQGWDGSDPLRSFATIMA